MSPAVLSGRAHRGLDGDRPAGGDRRRTRPCEPQRSGGWRPTAILLRDAKPLAAAENSWRPPLRHRRSRRSRPSARSGHPRRRGAHHQTRTAQGRDVAACAQIEQEAGRRGRRMTCTSAQTVASARDATGFARSPCSSRVLEISRRKGLQEVRTILVQRRVRRVDGPIHACMRRGKSTFSRLVPPRVRAGTSLPRGQSRRGVCVRVSLRHGIEPEGTKRQRRFERSRRARPAGRRPVLLLSELVARGDFPKEEAEAFRLPVASGRAMPASPTVRARPSGDHGWAPHPVQARWSGA